MGILYIFALLTNGMLIVLVNDYFKKNYPDKYDKFFVNISFNAIYLYLYSLIEILLQKLSNHTDKLYQHILIDSYHKNNIDFIKDGNIIYSTSKKNIQNKLTREYDFIIYSDSSSNSLKANNKIIKHYKVSESETFEYIESTVKFILSEVNILGEKMEIDFKTDTYNYYINNNIFDYKF